MNIRPDLDLKALPVTSGPGVVTDQQFIRDCADEARALRSKIMARIWRSHDNAGELTSESVLCLEQAYSDLNAAAKRMDDDDTEREGSRYSSYDLQGPRS